MNKVFVGGIPVDMDEGELKEIFTQYGNVVNTNIVRDKRTGESRRYGFVEMESEKAAVAVIDMLHGASIDDQEISVKPLDPNPKKKVTVGKRKILVAPRRPAKHSGQKFGKRPGKRPRIRKEF